MQIQSSSLIFSSRHKQRGVIGCLAKDSNFNPNNADNNGETPLHIACR